MTTFDRRSPSAPRILILTASVGSGHNRAAEAVGLAIQHLRPQSTVEVIDVLAMTNPAFRRVYGRSYFDLVDWAPHVIGYLYDRLDQPVRRPKLNRLRLRLQLLNLKRLTGLLIKDRWDLVICTHFLPAELVATLRRAGRVHFPQTIVTTDFDTHRLWVNEPCEHYFTATEEGRLNLSSWGVPLDRVTATGIPIHLAFSEWKSPADCRSHTGLPGNRPIVLQLSGGSGFGPVEAVHNQILQSTIPLDLVTVTGRNDSLKRRLESLPAPAPHRRRVVGYTRDIDQWMGAADLVVSKPGGLTTSEAMARGAAMLIIDPIPGQETRNSDYLLENGAAIKVNHLQSLPMKLTALLGEPGWLAQLRGNAKRLGRPRAACDVADQCLGLIDQVLDESSRSSTIRRQRVGV